MASCYLTGEICLDVHVPQFERLPAPGELLISQGLTTTLGGSAAYTALALRGLGMETWLKGKVGRDQTGDILRFLLEQGGIRVSLEETAQDNTEVALAFAQPGGKGYIAGKPLVALPAPGELEEAGATSLHLAGYLLFPELWNDGTLELLKWAKNSGLLVTMDSQMCAEPGRELELLNKELLSFVDVLFMDQHEVRQLFGAHNMTEAVRELRDLGAAIIAVKMGSLGSMTVTRNAIIRQPAHPVQPVNTVGAGDVYNGAFIYGMLQKWQVEQVTGFANIIAGFSTTERHRKYILPVTQALELWKQLQEDTR